MKTLKLLSGGAARGLVEDLRASFEAESGYRIDGAFGAVGAMRAKLLDGEAADVLILTQSLIAELDRAGLLVSGSAADIGAVETAIAVRQGDPMPRIADAATLRAALLAADAIYFPDPDQATAGIHFAKVLRDLAIWDDVATRLRPFPNGAAAMQALAAADSAHPIGCTQATEIIAVPGVAVAASLPKGYGLTTVYTAAVVRKSQASAVAARLIARLTDDAGRDNRKQAGFI